MNKALTLRVVGHVAELGPEWDALFEAAGDLQSSRLWNEVTIAQALPAGAKPALLALSDDAGPAGLLPMLTGPHRHCGSLTTPYTCLFQPLVRADYAGPTAQLDLIGRFCRRFPITRFEALDPAASSTGVLRRSLSSAGLVTRSFEHFGNWHEPVAGSWDDYLAARPSALRQTIVRRTRSAQKVGARLEVARDQPALDRAWQAYEDVYRRSWKIPEPYPAFNGAFVRAAASTRRIRVGVMWLGDVPIAAQYWSIDGVKATVLKLAHDEAHKPLSPGTVLTAATIRELIAVDGARELDFGRGDDPYKRNWVHQRRPRIGLLAFNVTTVTGLSSLARHDAGRIVRSMQERVSRRNEMLTKSG